jgi:hypothetical protein
MRRISLAGLPDEKNDSSTVRFASYRHQKKIQR